MPITPPMQIIPSLAVTNLLNLAGVPWPYVNECDVWALAELVRGFSQTITTSHQETTQHVDGIAQAYQAASTQTMQSGWSNLTDIWVSTLTGACEALATALDAAGWYIRGQKAWAVGVLVGMTTEIIVDQFLAVETLGMSELVAVGTVALARKVQQALVMALDQYIEGELIGMAIEEFAATIRSLLPKLNWSNSGATVPKSVKLSVNQEALAAETASLRHATASLTTQVASLANRMQSLSFV
jgi:hypothetical protein